MDVFCGGMYRACSTWQYEVSAQLLERHRAGRRLGYVLGADYPATLDQAQAGDTWRVLKAHEGDRSFARALAGGRALAIYAYRDVRDVAFSLMHKRQLTFDSLVRQGMLHQILVNDRFWSRQPGLLVQRYEDLIADPVGGVRGIARHLGITLAEGEAERVAADYSLETNRERTAALLARLVAAGVDLNDPANAQLWDNQTLLHWNHLRQGKAGDWREHATPDERATLLRVCGPWLRAHGYDTTPEPTGSRASLAGVVTREARLARAWVACAARNAALDHPKLARKVKRALGLPLETTPGRPAPIGRSLRFDPANAGAARSPGETATTGHGKA